MEYEVAFEIADMGLGNFTFVLPGLAFIIIGVFMIKNPSLLGKNRSKEFVKVFAYFFIGFAVLWVSVSGFAIGYKQHSLRSNYLAGNFEVVEGLVENFDPMPYSGHQPERFTVKGVKFSYSDYRLMPGFNNTTSHGGPIKAKLPVRISYIGNTILKLELVISANKSIRSTAKALSD
mgnify:CR=1 FL=1